MNNRVTLKIVCMATILAALGFGGNYFALPIAYGVAFIFGSIFSIIAIGLLGPLWGIGVAIVASSYTAILWNHPYALIIFTCEALWMAMAFRRGWKNVVLIDALYWLTIGALLVMSFYSGIMGMNSQSTLMICLKQSINGLFNALVAGIILSYTPIAKLTLNKVSRHTYKDLIFNVVCAFLIFPTLALLLHQNYRQSNDLNDSVAGLVKAETQEVRVELENWMNSHVVAIELLADLAVGYDAGSSGRLQERLGDIKLLFPDFHNVYVANSNATTVAFYPPKNSLGQSTIGLNFSDREYFKKMSDTGMTVISDVFLGRGGIFEPIFTISHPVMEEGKLSHFALGALNLDRLRTRLKAQAENNDLQITLLDSNNNVVYSSDEERESLKEFGLSKGRAVATSEKGVFLHVPGKQGNTAVMSLGKNAYYFSRAEIPSTDWTLHVEYSLSTMQEKLYASAINGLSAVALLFVPMLLIAFALSRYITAPLEAITKISKDIPVSIENDDEIDWPKTRIYEIESLIENFEGSAAALSRRIGVLNDRFCLAADSAEIGVFDYLIPEDKLIWDKWMYKLYGIEQENFLGAYQAWQDGLHPDDKSAAEESLNKALLGDESFDTEFRVVRPNGEVRYIKANALVQRDDAGKPVRMIGINYDITERKQALEDLREAVCKAEVANHAKSEFLANMSHEIRTPMNGVIGMTNLLLRTELNEKQHDLAQTVKYSAESLLCIINDILDFSKVEAGKLELETLDVDVNALVKECVTAMSFRGQEKGLQVTCTADFLHPRWFSGDPGRIRQVLTNLMGNAIKFTEQGVINVNYSLQKTTGINTLLRIEVTDTGIGLSEEQQLNIFQRFSQADGSTTRKYGGTGLGLAICKQLVALMGGEIGVDSRIGEGATFWFTVSLAPAQERQILPLSEADDAPKQSAATAAVDDNLLFKGKVLVVEDNAINQLVAEGQLEDFGLQVELADNGAEALKMLADSTYDLVLMDCQMPVMDGFEASRKIRDPQSAVCDQSIPIVAMTANVMRGDREKCVAAGMNDYISKPVDPEDLQKVLQRWLPLQKVELTS